MDNKLHVLKSGKTEEVLPEPVEVVARPKFNWKIRILLPGLVFGGFLVLLGLSAYSEFVPAVTVHASPVISKKVAGALAGAVTVQAAGWVEADPYKSYVTALTDGVIQEVLVFEGDIVQKGQVVATLVDEDARLVAQRSTDKVKELEATLASHQAELEAAKTEWENPIERRRAIDVAAAQLAETKATLEQVSAEIAVEESNLENAKSQHDRAAGLFDSKTISEQEYIRLRSQYNAQKSKISALQMKHAATKKLITKYEADLNAAQEHMNLRTEERRKLDSARAAVLQAEAVLNQGKTSLAEGKLRLERMSIRSPMDGIVMNRLIEPGSKVVVISDNPTSAKVISLYDPKRLQVRVDVPLADAGKVSVGQQAHVTVEILPDRPFSGTVTRVLHEANIQKNTLEVKVALSDPDPTLRPEMLARVKFLATLPPDADKEGERVFAPENAIRGTGANTVAWVVRGFDGNFGTAVPLGVKPGTSKSNGWIEVSEGLQPGDLVITGSVAELKNGKKVKIVTD